MKRRLKRGILSHMLALAVILTAFAGRIPVMAATTDDTSVTEGTEYTEEAQRLRSEIDSLIRENDKARESYKTDYWGYCTVTNTHQGGNHTIYGHQARIAVAFKPLDGNTALSARLSTDFVGASPIYNPNLVDSDGYYMYVSDWKTINYKGVYSMFYKIWTTGNGGNCDGRTARFHVWIDYK